MERFIRVRARDKHYGVIERESLSSFEHGNFSGNVVNGGRGIFSPVALPFAENVSKAGLGLEHHEF